MLFFSSLFLPKLPCPGEPSGSPELVGPLGIKPPMSLRSASMWGRFWDNPVLDYFQEKTGRGALRPCPNGWGV